MNDDNEATCVTSVNCTNRMHASPYRSQRQHHQTNAGHRAPHCSSDQCNELPVTYNTLYQGIVLQMGLATGRYEARTE